MSVPAHRLAALKQLQCRIFQTVYNPTGVRQGGKVLRERLKGPAVAAYYPRRVNWDKMLQAIIPEGTFYNEPELDRVEHVALQKSRGKGVVTKKRGPPEAYKKKK